MLNDMRRIALLILTLFPLLSQSIWAQPFVEIVSASGGMYACDDMAAVFIATPLVEGQGRWIANISDSRVKIDDATISIRSPKKGERFNLTYEFVQSNGTKRDTMFNIEVRSSVVIKVEQQGNRIVPVLRCGASMPSEYRWLVNGKSSNEFKNSPFETPTDRSAYYLVVDNQNGCTFVSGIVYHRQK